MTPFSPRPHPRPFSIVAKGANAGEGIFLFGGAIPKDPRDLKNFKDLNDAPPKNKLELIIDYFSGFIVGKRMTSRMLGEWVMSMTSLSMPMPCPAAGGIPYSRARM